MKNSLATETTVGRANSLEFFTCIYHDYNIEHTSIKIAVLPYDKNCSKFSHANDSRFIVLARNGYIVGILTAEQALPMSVILHTLISTSRLSSKSKLSTLATSSIRSYSRISSINFS